MSDESPYKSARPIGAIDAAILLGTLVLGTQLALHAIVVGVSVAWSVPRSIARETVATHPILASVAQVVVAAAILAVGRRFYLPGRRFADAFGVHAVPLRTVVLAAIAGATMQVPLAEIGNLVEEWVPVALAEKERLALVLAPRSFLDGLGLVLAVVAIAPVAEELVFRGLLLPGIARGSGIAIGVVVSTLAFGISHVRPGSVAVATVAGLVLGFVTVRTRSIVPSIVVHAANNAVPILVPAHVLPISGMNLVTDGPSHVAPGLLVVASGACVLALTLLVRETRD